jgi:hypothetical protein
MACSRRRAFLAHAHLAGGGYANNPVEELAHKHLLQRVRQPRLFRVEPIVSQHLERVMPSLMKAAGL